MTHILTSPLRPLLLLSLIVASLTLVPPAYAGGGKREVGPQIGKERPEKGEHGDRLAEILDLSVEQKAKIEALREKERTENIALRERLREQREQMEELALAEDFDLAAIKALANRQASLRSELAVRQITCQHEISMLLTPEQRRLAAKLRPLIKQRGERGERNGHRPRRGGDAPDDMPIF